MLSRFADMLGVRAFSQGGGDEEDEQDGVINAFRKHVTVPLVSMESAREHPCQGLADALTLRENFGSTKKLPVTLTWAPHIKPLPKAVPNSFLLTAAAAGCEVRVAHPPGFELHPKVRAEAEAYAKATGGSVTYTHDQDEALEGSRAVYAKAWGPATRAGHAPGDVAALLAVVLRLDAYAGAPCPGRQGRHLPPLPAGQAATWKWPTRCWITPPAVWWIRRRTASTSSAPSSTGSWLT